MTLDNLSIRLGMHHGLYIGTCIGVILTSLIVLFECCVLNGGITHILAASLALICAGLLAIGFICMLENKEFSMSDLACTCRYRRSIDPICSKCALSCLNQKNGEYTPNNEE